MTCQYGVLGITSADIFIIFFFSKHKPNYCPRDVCRFEWDEVMILSGFYHFLIISLGAHCKSVQGQLVEAPRTLQLNISTPNPNLYPSRSKILSGNSMRNIFFKIIRHLLGHMTCFCNQLLQPLFGLVKKTILEKLCLSQSSS